MSKNKNISLNDGDLDSEGSSQNEDRHLTAIDLDAG